MAYGGQITLANGVDMVIQVTPLFVLDFITSASGSKTYAVPTGRSLSYTAATETSGGIGSRASVTINGNTVNWSGASVRKSILIYAG